jgi:DNA-nicking Smr family endonuclease
MEKLLYTETMNKYQKTPELIIDFHGYTVREAKSALNKLLAEGQYLHVRIITGKGVYREHGSVLGPFVRTYLQERNIKFNQAKIQDGGEGAIEVYLHK